MGLGFGHIMWYWKHLKILFLRVLSAQGSGDLNQKGRVWLRVVRDGELVLAWGESPEEGVGNAPHYEAEVDAYVPLTNTLDGDIVQVQMPVMQRPYLAVFRVVESTADC